MLEHLLRFSAVIAVTSCLDMTKSLLIKKLPDACV